MGEKTIKDDSVEYSLRSRYSAKTFTCLSPLISFISSSQNYLYFPGFESRLFPMIGLLFMVPEGSGSFLPCDPEF